MGIKKNKAPASGKMNLIFWILILELLLFFFTLITLVQKFKKKIRCLYKQEIIKHNVTLHTIEVCYS